MHICFGTISVSGSRLPKLHAVVRLDALRVDH